MALHEQPVAIAVIGVTGSGKSTFINLASGSNLPSSNSLGSRTTELKSSTFSLDGRTVTLIDTPGFDDTTQNVLNVLKLISDSFSGLRGAKLAGVIYMHRLTEDRLGGPSGHNFLIFRKFCGDASLRDVFIVTNGWSKQKISESEARDREVSLKDELFGPAIDKGARMLRHDGSRASAHAILRHLINREPAAPSIHGDAFDRGTKITHTTTEADPAREPTGQTGNRAVELGSFQGRIDVETAAEDAKTKDTQETLQENDDENSPEEIERTRCNLEKMVANFAVENSRLEDENRRYKEGFSAQRAETQLRTRLLGEERKARELAEAELGRAEAQLARERALWERHRMERESLKNHAGPVRDKLFVCGALVFALACVSRFMFDGSTFLR